MFSFSKQCTIAGVAIALFFTISATAAEPLQTYLTYSDDPVTTMDVNFYIEEQVPSAYVYLDTVSRGGDKEQYAQRIRADYRQTTLEIYDGRALYVAALKGLAPGTVYYFVAGDKKNGFTKERSFRTLPGGDKPFRFIDGGDMGTDELPMKLQELAGKQDPDFAVIGGDIPYSNGLLAEFKDWEEWFANWDKYMVCNDGRMIPIVAAIGNHEVNHYQSDVPELRSPDYLSFFGHQAEKTYYARKVGDNAVFFILDSGHIAPQNGAQTEWLANEMERYKDVPFKFAAYHVPLYPTHRPYEGPPSQIERDNWGPLFDQYALTVGFEHHDHVFKRTKPLKGNQVVEKGTVYVGDGAFGVNPREVDNPPRWYDEKAGSIAHFWVVDVKPGTVELKAIDENGATVDAFSLP